MFLTLSFGGLISYYFSKQIVIPDQTSPPLASAKSVLDNARSYLVLIRTNPAFASFSTKRFVYFSAIALSLPIMPLYYVRDIGATDSQIGTINMTMTTVMLVGYFFWPWLSRKRSGRFVLLATTLGMAFHGAHCRYVKCDLDCCLCWRCGLVPRRA